MWCLETLSENMTNSDDCPLKSNNTTPADEALALELLKDLDLGAAPPANLAMGSPALQAVNTKQAARKRPGKSTKPSAVAERRDYRLVKVSEGKGEPRPYQSTGIAPRRIQEGHFETEAEYQRRYKREHARLTRGVTAEDIENNELIRQMATAEERKAKKAAAARAKRAAMTQADKDADALRKKLKRRKSS